jgi:rSAM/selenodomain-associated transferase 1
MSDCLGLFAKYWQPGQVKTRLAASIGDNVAAEIYQHFVTTLINRLQNLGDQRWLAVTPPEKAREFESLTAEHWQLEPQVEGDLGERMQAFFSKRLAEGADRVILLGTDSPNVPLDYIQQAWELLHDNDAVLGPTEDGGYWLVGVSTDVPELFVDIPWSSPQVWEATHKALQNAGRSFASVPDWYDIDEHYDLQRLILDLQEDVGIEPELDSLLESIK